MLIYIIIRKAKKQVFYLILSHNFSKINYLCLLPTHRHSREHTLPSAVYHYPMVNFDCRPSLRTNPILTKTNRFLMQRHRNLPMLCRRKKRYYFEQRRPPSPLPRPKQVKHRSRLQNPATEMTKRYCHLNFHSLKNCSYSRKKQCKEADKQKVQL